MINLNDDSGLNAADTVVAAIADVRPGFIPSNPAFRAGFGATGMGAMDGPLSGSCSIWVNVLGGIVC